MTDRIEPFEARDRTTKELLSLLAGETVREVPSPSELARMTPVEMAERLGIDGEGVKKIQTALELSRRTVLLQRKPLSMMHPGAVAHYFQERLGHYRKESFWVLTLDQKHNPLDCHRISEGTLSMTPVHPREAFIPALRDSAAAVIFVHNHPSGDPEPSHEDHLLTDRLSKCGDLLGIRVLDHLVVGSDGHYSFRDHGYLETEYGSRVAETARETSSCSAKRERAERSPGPAGRSLPEKTKSVGPEKEPARIRERDRDDGRGR